MRLFTLFAFAFFSLSSAQALNVDRPNISSVVQNGTIAHLPNQLNGTNEELSLAQYQSNQSSDQLNQTKYELEQLKEQLKQTKYQLDEANKQRKVDKANAESCVSQVAAQNMFSNTIKTKCCRAAADYAQMKADFTWVVESVGAFLNGSTRELFSDEFELRGYQFRVRAKLAWCKSGVVCLGLLFKDKDGRERPIDVSVFPIIVGVVKDQSSSIKRKDWFCGYIDLFNVNRNIYDTFYYYQVQSNATDVINTTLYTANDTMVMDVYFEPPEEAELVYSYNGTLTWAVDNYREKIRMARDGQKKASWSPYFYTGWKGYRLQAFLFYNGYGNYTEKGLSIRIYVVNGRFDKHLEKFVSHHITVTIFNPIEDDRKITKKMNTDELKSTIDVGSHEEIDKLLYENTLYYTVTAIAA